MQRLNFLEHATAWTLTPIDVGTGLPIDQEIARDFMDPSGDSALMAPPHMTLNTRTPERHNTMQPKTLAFHTNPV